MSKITKEYTRDEVANMELANSCATDARDILRKYPDNALAKQILSIIPQDVLDAYDAFYDSLYDLDTEVLERYKHSVPFGMLRFHINDILVARRASGE